MTWPIVLLILAIIILEMVCRYWIKRKWDKRNQRIKPTYSWSMWTQNNIRIGRQQGIFKLMLHPARIYSNYPNQGSTNFRINSQGFRGIEVGLKEETKERIVLLGASTAFGTGLKSDGDALHAQLENQIPDSEVINAGVLGYLSGQEMIYLITQIVDLKPDKVIVLNGYNDYRLIGEQIESHWIDMNGLGHIELELGWASRFLYSGILTRFRYMHESLFTDSIDIIKQSKWVRRLRKNKSVQSTAHALTTDEVVESYVNNVLKMKKTCDSHGVEFYCVLQPSRPETQKEFNPKEADSYGSFCEQIKVIFRKNNINHLDLNDHTKSLLPEMFMDKVHLDASGQIKMSQIISKALVESKVSREF